MEKTDFPTGLESSVALYALKPTRALADHITELAMQAKWIPVSAFLTLTTAGRAAALLSWLEFHLENPKATSFSPPGDGREY